MSNDHADLFTLSGVEPPDEPASAVSAAPRNAAATSEAALTTLPTTVAGAHASVTPPADSGVPPQTVQSLTTYLRIHLLRALACSATARADSIAATVDSGMLDRIAVDQSLVTAQAEALLNHPVVIAAAKILGLGAQIPDDVRRSLTASERSTAATPRAGAAPPTTQSAATPRRAAPTVREVVLFSKRSHAYAVPDRTVAATRYATPTTLRVLLPDGTERSVRYAEAVPLPDNNGAVRVQLDMQYLAYAAALEALRAGLVALGPYADRLADACGAMLGADLSERDLARAPNPLTATVVVAPVPPSGSERADPVYNLWQLPDVSRTSIVRHTPKMLVLASARGIHSAPRAQRGHFCCPDDAAWIAIARLVNAACRAHAALHGTLQLLGTYGSARSTQPLVAARPAATTQPAKQGVSDADPAKAAA